jgi:glycosyltransferase involved in cell wall biosynthesis
MKILHVTLGFYPATAWGGPVKIVYQNGKELLRRGHSVTIYCTNLLDKRHKIEPNTFEREIDGMRVVYFDTWRVPQWPGTLGPIWLPHLQSYLARELSQFDVVHLNGYRNLMLVPVSREARRTNIPFVIQPHGAIPIIVNSFAVKRVYDRLLGGQEIDGLSALIAGQESERQQAIGLGVPKHRIEIIPNGLDTTERKNVPPPGTFRRRYGIPDNLRLILFLARINRKKGTDMLVEAFAQMSSPDAHLAIVGPDDGQLDEVKALIRQHQLEPRVTLTGLLEGEDVMSAFQDADLFVLPCRTDTFPMTVIEACLVNTPMVITDRCEIAHLVKDRIADVVPFDATAFAAAMQDLLTDRERYARYQANCPATMADTFSIQAVGDQLEALYARVIEEKQVDAKQA